MLPPTKSRKLSRPQALDSACTSAASLRHTAASWLVMQGVDLYAVGKFLGHKTTRMTQKYAHLSPRYMAGTLSKLDAVFGAVVPENVSGETALVPVESPLYAQLSE